MSLSLTWTRKIEWDGSFETGLKWVLEKKFRPPYPLTRNEIPYIEGLRDGFDEKTKEWRKLTALIEAIEKYDEVTLEYR